ncbi:MAG: CAP domain-containing protein [Fimbriimonadaceae bacterium]|nr:CAP domain-containing protein [Fimbriimonadaceae bacterium]
MTHYGRPLLAAMLLLRAVAAAPEAPSFWLGSPTGDELSFSIAVPADAAAIIRHQKPAPGRGDDTNPRYSVSTATIAGRAVKLHVNELGWETPKLGQGALTWVVNAGIGADWRVCRTSDPLWSKFAAGLAAVASSVEGWSMAKVVMAEVPGKAAPTFRVNRDGTVGTPAPEKVAEWRLRELSGKDALTAEELEAARRHMLTIANAARADRNYRRAAGCQAALDLPANLPPLTLSAKLNRAAQIQAQHCAAVKEATHDHPDPELADVGQRLKSVGVEKTCYEAAGSGPLSDSPAVWMRSETHYRPWWNLDDEVVTEIGFGLARADDGSWYFIAVFT